MAFLGNIFVPLTGTMLAIAKFTPLYGYVALARYPLTEGYQVDGSHEPLWIAVTNVTVWAVISVWGRRAGAPRPGAPVSASAAAPRPPSRANRPPRTRGSGWAG